MYRPGPEVQVTFEDRMLNANEQTRKAVASSRAKLVGDIVYPQVDEEKFAGLYSEVGSRPNIPIQRYVSALILKRMYGMSDENLIEFLRCGALNIQYALHTTQDETQPISASSLRRFRRKLESYNEEHNCDLIREEFERISKKMAIEMGVLHADPNECESEGQAVIVRIDSMEIEAHAKAMTRIEILYMTNVIMIRYLLKKDFAAMIPEELGHYMADGDHNQVLYYQVSEDRKAGEQDNRVAKAVREMLLLEEALLKNFTSAFLDGIPEYQIFQRVLKEQTQMDENGRRIPRDKKDISADSVQNPFDETVTYRYKRGPHHGFVLNVAEAVDGTGNGILVHAVIEPNTESDSRMAEEYVKQLPDDGPEQILVADGAYNSDTLEALAKDKNVKIHTTALTGKTPEDIVADFVLNDDKTEILSCPAGKEPVSCKYNPRSGYLTAEMPENCRAACPHREKCKAKINEKKQKSSVRVTGKMVSRAKQARNFATESGKVNARCRNGVEGVMSVLRRKYDVDHIPVFGLGRIKTWIWTALLAYNLAKYQKYILLRKRFSLA